MGTNALGSVAIARLLELTLLAKRSAIDCKSVDTSASFHAQRTALLVRKKNAKPNAIIQSVLFSVAKSASFVRCLVTTNAYTQNAQNSAHSPAIGLFAICLALRF